MSRSLLLDALGATIAVFVLCGLLSLFVFQLGFMDPVHSAMHHVEQELENHVHAVTNAQTTKPYDPQIAIVDIGTADRARMGQLLDLIRQQQPAMVGVDVVFDKKNAPADTGLSNALSRLATDRKLVMASWLQVETHTWYASDTLFRFGAMGYTNFVSAEDEGVVRHHLPMTSDNSRSFAAEIVARTKPALWNRYWEHLNKQPEGAAERILFQPENRPFLQLNEAAVRAGNPDLSKLRGRIILLGALSDVNDPYGAEDIHRVPIADTPRMSGLMIHANIIAMMLGEASPTTISRGLLWVVSFFLCWAVTMFYIWAPQQKYRLFRYGLHLVFKVVQLVLAAVVVGISMLLFHYGRIEMATLPLLAPVALSVDVLYIYEPFAHWLSGQKRFTRLIPYQTYFKDAHAH